MNLEMITERIQPLDDVSIEQAAKRWLTVGKPLFSLGALEDAIIRMAGMKRSVQYGLLKKGLILMCADNGVVAEGVTQAGQEVTAIVADNFTKGDSSVCHMCNVAGTDVFPVDIGMAVDVPSVPGGRHKVAYGTRNFVREPAMTQEEVARAIQVGIDVVEDLKNRGYDILATGEMGIGNTTTSSAVASVLLQKDVELMTGKGAGLDSEGLKRKISAIRRGIELHKPNPMDPVDVLMKVGGLDIAGLTGVFLGGAIYGVPIVIDGFISSTAALCAVRIAEAAKEYMLPSHVSKEPGGQILLDALGFSPFITCGMFLGEGTGAVALFPLLDMALRVYTKMGTFDEIHVEPYQIMQ